jgi:hypothetical protein
MAAQDKLTLPINLILETGWLFNPAPLPPGPLATLSTRSALSAGSINSAPQWFKDFSALSGSTPPFLFRASPISFRIALIKHKHDASLGKIWFTHVLRLISFADWTERDQTSYTTIIGFRIFYLRKMKDLEYLDIFYTQVSGWQAIVNGIRQLGTGLVFPLTGLSLAAKALFQQILPWLGY